MLKAHSVLVGGLIVAGLISAHTRAIAEEERSYPGAVCTQTSAGGTLGRYGGTIYNSSSSAEMDVICPLTKVVYQIGNSTYIDVFNRNGTVNFSCTIYQEYCSGSACYSTAEEEHTTSYGSDVQVITYHYQSLPILGAEGEYYYATCTIPRTYSSNLSHLAAIKIHDIDPP